MLPKPDAHIEVLTKLSGEQQLELFQQNAYAELSQHYLSVLHYLQRYPLLQLGEETKIALNLFIERFLFFFSQASFELPASDAERFIAANANIANLTALSELQTTDAYLQKVAVQENGLAKLLTLYSARNTVRIDRSALFQRNPQLASRWYMAFFDTYTSALADNNALEHLRMHLESIDPRIDLGRAVNRVYFACTYIDPEKDAAFKQFINTRVQENHPVTLEFGPEHRNNKIAVFSGCWRNTHAVYKNQFAFIESLRDDYQLTFFPLRNRQDTSLFHKIDHSCREGPLHLESFQRENFAAVYFPDVGMTEQSIILANLRLAPLQIASFGHSVSSFGSKVDYFIAGEEVEDISLWQENYSERLVILPGLGMVNLLPEVPAVVSQDESDVVRIACPWSAPKCSAAIIQTLKRIVAHAQRPLHFLFLAGGGVTRANGYLPFVRQLESTLQGASVEVLPHLPYPEYLEKIGQCDFALDSFHFGGCNSVVDVLLLGKAILSQQGSKWYNRIGGAQLKHIGLGELVHQSDDSYCEQALRIINEPGYLAALEEKIHAADIANGALFSTQPAVGFKRAIDYLMANHHQLSKENTRAPIEISLNLSD